MTMAVSHIKATFSCGLPKVWDAVVSLKEYSWRSDLDRIEIREPGKQFVEFTKEGYPTTFTITVFQPCERYEFDMENGNMRGHWVGLFSEQNGQTTVDFTEDVTAKKVMLRPFVGGYLKKQQALYVADLRKFLETNKEK